MIPLFLALLLLTACTATTTEPLNDDAPEAPVICSKDAKICPDQVTLVYREGPNCLFPACPNYVPDTSCTRDEDCVPAECCHPKTVVNKNSAPDCQDVSCTRSCEGPLDCGRGTPVCEKGTCKISPDTTFFTTDELSYVSQDPKACQTMRIRCEEGLVPFNDARGCGCEPDTSSIGLGTVCEPAQREAQVCTLEYSPVCGWFSPEVQCLIYPCAQTFGNACGACANPKVAYYTAGECPSK